jgi:hypothetical protein
MKNIIITALILCLGINYAEAKENKFHSHLSIVDTLPTTQLISFLEQMDVDSYYGRAVDSFLLAIPSNLFNLKVYGGDNSQGALFRAKCLVVDFTPNSTGPRAIIHVRQYTYLNRYSPTATWDVNLFRKEKIYKIEIYKNQTTCINGWCMQ